MALGNPNNTYTPFQETSFGYGSGEVAALTDPQTQTPLFPNATDIVKVRITISGWMNTTGHISTPSVGTAVSVYNASDEQWEVKGQRDDVDAVLAQLKFFPSDYPSTRNWTPTALKDNEITGDYGTTAGDEEPDTIPNTTMTLFVYDSTDTLVSSYNNVFQPTGYGFNNQRPFWSVEPAAEDLTGHGTDVLDLGTISHGTDTENVQVIAKMYDYGTIQVGSYGSTTNNTRVYVADKKPSATADTLFDFTGSVAEAQAFLDTMKFTPSGSTTFDLYMEITDGVVGSRVTKKCWFSQQLALSTIPSQSYTEDQTFSVNVGTPTISNLSNLPDVAVGTWRATITLDATGAAALESIDGTGATLKPNGDIVVTTSTFNELVNRLNVLEMEFTQDFDDSFTFDIFVTASDGYGSNVSSYTSATQTVSVTGASAVEVTNLSTSHTVQEEITYSFSPYPQVVHPDEETFSFVFTLSDANAGTLVDTHGRITNQGSGVFTLLDTKANVNASLAAMEFIPAIDYETDFTISFTADRTTGDLTYHTQTTGVMNIDVVPRAEVTPATSSGVVSSWNEDVAYVEFDSGIEILDRATENPDYPSYYGTYYEVHARAKYIDQTTGLGTNLESINITTANIGALNSSSGTGKGSDPFIMTGTKSALNGALDQMRFIPDADFHSADSTNGSFYIEYKVIRQQDSLVYYDFSTTNSIPAGIASDEFTFASSVNYGLEVITDLNDMYRIVDAAVNKTYFVTFTLGTNAQDNVRLSAAAQGSATVNWNATQYSLEIQGTKQDINDTLNTLELVPFYNFNQDFSLFIYQYQQTDGIQQSIGGTHVDFVFDASVLPYTLDTAPKTYLEDATEQQLFLTTTFESHDAAATIENLSTQREVEYRATISIGGYSGSMPIFFSGNYVENRVPLGSYTGDYVDDGYVEDRGSELLLIGTQESILNIIRNLEISGFPDANASANIVVTIDRYLDGVYSKSIASSVNAIQLQSSDSLEATVSSQTQLITDSTAVMNDGSAPNSEKLYEYSLGVYERLVNVLDSAVAILDTGAEVPAAYRIQATSTIPTELTLGSSIDLWRNKSDFNTFMDDGIDLSVNTDTVTDGTQYTFTFDLVRVFAEPQPNGTIVGQTDPETGDSTTVQEVIHTFNITFEYVKQLDFYDLDTSSLLDTEYLSVREVRSYGDSLNQTWEQNRISGDSFFAAPRIITSKDGTTQASATHTLTYSGTQNIDMTTYTDHYKLELDEAGTDFRTVTITAIDTVYGLKNTKTLDFKKWNMYYEKTTSQISAVNTIRAGYYEPNTIDNASMMIGGFVPDASDYNFSTDDVYWSMNRGTSFTSTSDPSVFTKYGWISIDGWFKSDQMKDLDTYNGNCPFITILGNPVDPYIDDQLWWDQAYYFEDRLEDLALYVDQNATSHPSFPSETGRAMAVGVDAPFNADSVLKYTDGGVSNMKYYNTSNSSYLNGYPMASAPYTSLTHNFGATPTGATGEYVKCYLLRDEGWDTWTVGGHGGLSNWYYGTPKFAYVKSYENNGIRYYQVMYGEFYDTGNTLTSYRLYPKSTSVSGVTTTEPSFTKRPVKEFPPYMNISIRVNLSNNTLEYRRGGAGWKKAFTLPTSSTDSYRFIHGSNSAGNSNKAFFSTKGGGYYATVAMEIF